MSKGGGIEVYQYHIGLHLALCHGPVDELTKIVFADKVGWIGSATGGTIYVDNPELFGGDDNEGGVQGFVDVLMGKASQGENAYLKAQLNKGEIPAWRGVFALVFRAFYYATNNSYLKEVAIQARRTDIHNDGSAMWYAAKSRIGDDMNPAHVIRECLTDRVWGMGYEATAYIDDASFTAAADTLYVENFGFSFIWDGSDKIGNLIEIVNNHINGVVRMDRSTGKIQLKLIRDDYDVGTIPLFDESNVTRVESYQRAAWEETVNEVTVIYHKETTDKDVPVTVHDIGNWQIQGRRVAKTLRMPGISGGALALRVAQRELRANATPLSAIKLRCNRTVWGIGLGDVFKFSWTKYGIVQQVFRVTEIDWGTLDDAEVTVTAVEDVFSLPVSSFGNVQDSEWDDPIHSPSALTVQRTQEATYWDAIFHISAADRNHLDPDYGFIAALGVRPYGDYLQYKMATRVGAAAYAVSGSGKFCPSAVIATALVKEVSSTFAYTGGVDMQLVQEGRYAYIEDEIVEIVTVTPTDDTTGTITANRGVLDTVPDTHPAGNRLWFAEGYQGFDRTERVAGETVDVKLLPQTPLGTLDEASATALPVGLDNRAQRPYPPGNVKFDGVRYPSGPLVDQIAVSWAHRDRLQQTASLIDQTAGNIGPEAGTTYTLVVKNSVGTPVDTISGISGTSQVLDPPSGYDDDATIELYSVRDGLDSWQAHAWTFHWTDTGAVPWGDRGVWGGGYTTTYVNTIDYVDITTPSNATDFGDLTAARFGVAAASNGARGVFGGGMDATNSMVLDYVTFASAGNATSFGALTVPRRYLGAASNVSRGVWGGGSDASYSNVIDYADLATPGDATDFGDLTAARQYVSAVSSGSRGVWGGGNDASYSNVIDYVEIAISGNATDFGDLTVARHATGAVSNGSRGVWGGGYTGSNSNVLDYISLATPGNATDFGDLTVARRIVRGTSNGSRGVFGGGYTTDNVNIIDYVEIDTTGNATDFGDLSVTRRWIGAASGD